MYFQTSPFSGTGSIPKVPQGLQRNIRKNARKKPTIMPCFITACMQYCEQVGLCRQESGNIGEITARYINTGSKNIFLIN